MKKSFVLSAVLALFVSFPLPVHSQQVNNESGEPDWLQQAIIPRDGFIYAVGHSQDFDSEAQAREDAVSDATQAFVKYCRVEVESFDRSMELYSRNKGRQDISAETRSARVVRSNAFVTRAVPDDWYIERSGRKYKASVLLKVPKEEFDRISKERDVKLSIDILFYYEDEKGKLQPMSENSVLSSGEGYAVYMNPSDTCWLYVFQVDASGKAFRLFPNNEYATLKNPVQPGFDLWLPNDTKLYTLDETTGKEHIYVFASPAELKEFEGSDTAVLTKTALDNVIKMKKMGVAGVKDKISPQTVAPKRLADMAEVKKKLQSQGAFVYETWFWHK